MWLDWGDVHGKNATDCCNAHLFLVLRWEGSHASQGKFVDRCHICNKMFVPNLWRRLRIGKGLPSDTGGNLQSNLEAAALVWEKSVKHRTARSLIVRYLLYVSIFKTDFSKLQGEHAVRVTCINLVFASNDQATTFGGLVSNILRSPLILATKIRFGQAICYRLQFSIDKTNLINILLWNMVCLAVLRWPI